MYLSILKSYSEMEVTPAKGVTYYPRIPDGPLLSIRTPRTKDPKSEAEKLARLVMVSRPLYRRTLVKQFEWSKAKTPAIFGVPYNLPHTLTDRRREVVRFPEDF